jgi:mxaC protein
MMTIAVDHPFVLLLLVGCVPPLFGFGWRWPGFPSVIAVPRDRASRAMDWGLRILAALPVACIVLGLAGLHEGARTVERIGQGAHVVVVLDRSLSMDEKFALAGEKTKESKTEAAARMLGDFFAHRPHDSFGIVAFSSSPIQVLPLTAHREALAAAIAAMRQKALANTDIGAGLAVGLMQFARDPPGAARVLLLISDGAGAIPEQTRDYIRAEMAREQAHLYYLYLRAGDDPPLEEGGGESGDLSRPSGLDGFFRRLGATYAGFEARNPGAAEAAAARIDALETRPIVYRETHPRVDLDFACYEAAAICLAISVLAQMAERSVIA